MLILDVGFTRLDVMNMKYDKNLMLEYFFFTFIKITSITLSRKY